VGPGNFRVSEIWSGLEDAINDHSPQPSVATVALSTLANKISGKFRLSYNGQLTGPLSYDISPALLRSELLKLSSIRDNVLQVGDCSVARRGPGRQGEYSWYIAITQSLEEPLDGLSAVLTNAGLQGLGSAIRIHTIRWGPRDFSLRILPGAAGVVVSNTVDDLGLWQPTLEFQGPPKALIEAFNYLEYKPGLHWSGDAAILIHVQDSVSGASASNVVYLRVEEVRNVPVVYWRKQPIPSFGSLSESKVPANTFETHEDTDATLADDLSVSADRSVLSVSKDLFHAVTSGMMTARNVYFNVQKWYPGGS